MRSRSRWVKEIFGDAVVVALRRKGSSDEEFAALLPVLVKARNAGSYSLHVIFPDWKLC